MNSLEKKYWKISLVWVGLIYGSLPIVRPICEFLIQTTPFNLMINFFIISLLLGSGFVLILKIKIKKPLAYLGLLIIFSAYLYLLNHIKIPAEKVHLIQYGVLAILLHKALRERYQNVSAYIFTFILASLFGWIDEGIQYLLPDRYYQIQDVFLNMLSAGLGILLAGIIRYGTRDP